MTQSAYTGQRRTPHASGAAGFSVKIPYRQTRTLLQEASSRLDERAAARVKVTREERR